MRKLTLHARIEITLAMGLLLGSCGDSAYQRFTVGDYNQLQEASDLADAANANARTALSRTSELESRIEDLERRLRYQY